jgi:hypothetical protein
VDIGVRWAIGNRQLFGLATYYAAPWVAPAMAHATFSVSHLSEFGDGLRRLRMER